MNNKEKENQQEKPALRKVELVNGKQAKLEVLNFGASLFSLKLPKKTGGQVNVLVSPRDPEDFLSPVYKAHNKCFGASVGRYAGRISEGGFRLDDREYPLSVKHGVHLHGGDTGFAYKFWKIEEVSDQPNPSVRLSYFSKDGEEGYPGNLQVAVTYTLTEENEVRIEYTATTDKPTVVNLTNHAYFNLNGAGNVKSHLLRLKAEKVMETGKKLIPTGNFLDVRGTTKDYTSLWSVGSYSLDDAFLLQSGAADPILLKGDKSGIVLEIETNQPAVIVYSPEKLPKDWDYQTNIGSSMPSICLETQNLPDAPQNSEFPSSVLRPGEVYRNSIRWKFSEENSD